MQICRSTCFQHIVHMNSEVLSVNSWDYRVQPNLWKCEFLKNGRMIWPKKLDSQSPFPALVPHYYPREHYIGEPGSKWLWIKKCDFPSWGRRVTFLFVSNLLVVVLSIRNPILSSSLRQNYEENRQQKRDNENICGFKRQVSKL